MAKQNFLQKLFFRRQKASATRLIRAFKGGESNRLTTDWIAASPHADHDIKHSIEIVRSRARDLCQNNDYAKRFINLCLMNIVGADGFVFQSKVTDPNGAYDQQANLIIEKSWAEWSKPENCTVTGRLNFIEVQKLLISQAARDGEFFVHILRTPESKFGFQLQILEPDDIDHNYNQDLNNGNFIRLGIEFNSYRKPVAYYFKKNNKENISFAQNNTKDFERVEAKDVIHCYIQERARQSRGISWLHASMYRLKQLQGYEEAALVNARVGAAKMGFFTNEMGDEYLGDSADVNGNVQMTAEPGSFEQLPPGMKFQSFEPDFPQQQYSDYVKACLRGIASGLGVSYNLLANDLEGVSYSSIRSAILDERNNWMHLQSWFIGGFLQPLFKNWLEMGLLRGAISLPMAKFEKFDRAEFIGRRWQWVDPKSDIEAKLLELNAGFISATQVAAEMGRDLEDIYRDREREKELAKQYGLDFTINNPEEAVENIKPKLKSVVAEKYNRENTSFTSGNILEGILNNE